jgi:hypothetical protein
VSGSPVDRRRDRRITTGGAVLAAAVLLAAIGALLVPSRAGLGPWLPLHLALAGAASLAIAAVLPFFTTTLAAAPPASPALRIGAIVLVAGGAAAALLAYPSGVLPVAAAGAIVFAIGIGLTGVAAFRPLALARRAPPRLVLTGYGVALGDVIVGVSLAALYLAGWAPLVAAWPLGLAAHAWLDLLGFVSLAIAATLVHLLPTVLATRIRMRPAAIVAVGCLMVAAPLVAAGMLVHAAAAEPATPLRGMADQLARIGSLALIGGALALAAFAASTWRARGRWTTDRGWHRWIVGALASAIAWFLVATGLAAGAVARLGADPAAWSIETVGPPLLGGWLALALLGSVAHLVPSIGPGGPVRHARQRDLLGRAALARLALLDGGVAVSLAAVATGAGWLAPAATIPYGLGLLWTVVLVARAVATRDEARGDVGAA